MLPISLRRVQRRPVRYGSVGFGCSASIFDLYEQDAHAVLSHIDDVPSFFHHHGTELLHLWNRANERAAVRAAVRWMALGKAIIEICDATEDPFWLIYPVDGQWQADEYDGSSHRVPTLKAALELIFPF